MLIVSLMGMLVKRDEALLVKQVSKEKNQKALHRLLLAILTASLLAEQSFYSTKLRRLLAKEAPKHPCFVFTYWNNGLFMTTIFS